ncbi:MAG: glycosyltransferase family 39 protein [Bdellovibrionales bacterium]|nr:glycosyltransferase family 39 protein [Bdellovibrionales bacterium]
MFRTCKAGFLPIGMDYDQVREAFHASELFNHFDVIIDNVLFLHLASLHIFQSAFGLTALANYANASFWFLSSLIPIFLLVKELFRSASAQIAVLFLLYSLAGFTMPRLGHVGISVLPFAFWAYWALYRCLKTEQTKYFLLLGVICGIGFFSFLAFKAVLVTVLILFLAISLLKYDFKLHKPFWRLILKLTIVPIIFLSIVYIFAFTSTGKTFSFNDLHFLLFKYSSNGQILENISTIFHNSKGIIYWFLPVEMSVSSEFMIPRTTGSTSPLFYISPLISLLFLMFWFQFCQTLWNWKYRSKHSDRIGEWYHEYNWIFATGIFLGGCLPALISDHTAVRRWIYAWFWIYPLSAVALDHFCLKKNKIALKTMVLLIILSEVFLTYKAYISKPWRTNGPSIAIMSHINNYCEQDFNIGVTSIAYHWVRFYQKIRPLPAHCHIYELRSSDETLVYPGVIFDIPNLYHPIPSSNKYASETIDNSEHQFIKRFSDKYDFEDFIVTELKPNDFDQYRQTFSSSNYQNKYHSGLRALVNRPISPVTIEYPIYDMGLINNLIDDNLHTLLRIEQQQVATLRLYISPSQIKGINVTVSHASKYTVNVKVYDHDHQFSFGSHRMNLEGKEFGSAKFLNRSPKTVITMIEVTADVRESGPNALIHINEINWK